MNKKKISQSELESYLQFKQAVELAIVNLKKIEEGIFQKLQEGMSVASNGIRGAYISEIEGQRRPAWAKEFAKRHTEAEVQAIKDNTPKGESTFKLIVY